MVDKYIVINGQFVELKPEFNGSNYSSKHDKERLTGQIKRIFDLMKDGEWRTFSEIKSITGDPEASISAQLRNLRKERFGSYDVRKRYRGNRDEGLFEYIINL